jgi:membrane protease YdiL (CAAX protease family)
VEEPKFALPVEDVAVAAAPAGAAPRHARPLPRWFAIAQAIAVSGVPTGLLVATVLMVTTNVSPFEGNGLSLEFLSTVTLLDTALIALLIRVFLELSGEDSRGVFLGWRPVTGEIVRGVLLVPVMFAAVTGIVLGLRAVAPWLHTVKVSPLEQYMRSPLDASIFLVVVVLGGGVREELQRAFILHRFEQRLGGVKLGLVVFSLVFGLLHVDQGVDVALAVGSLGLFWGLLYIKRRSAVMGMANHAGFNALQVVQGVLARALGV